MSRPLTSLVIFLALSIAPAARAAEVIVWLPLLAADERVDAALRERIDGELRDALTRLPDVTVPSQQATNESIAAAAALQGCNRKDAKCMARVAALAGGSRVASGSISLAVGGVQVKLRLVDARSAAETATASALVPVDPPRAVTDAARLLVVRLVSPGREVGFIAVRASPADATVTVDDEIKGTSSSRPIEVKPGTHRVAVSRVGYESQTISVEARVLDTSTIDVTLKPEEEKTAAPEEAKPTGDGRPLLLVNAFEATNVDPAEVRMIEDLVAGAAADANVRVMSHADVKDLAQMAAGQQSVGCDAEAEACKAEIMAAMGAELMFTGNYGKLGDLHLLTLTLTDLRTPGKTEKKQIEVGGDPSKQIKALTLEQLKKARPELMQSASASSTSASSTSSPVTVLPVVTVVTGAAIVVVAGGILTGAELIAGNKSGSGEERATAQTVGLWSMGGVALGAVVAGVGGVLWAMEGD